MFLDRILDIIVFVLSEMKNNIKLMDVDTSKLAKKGFSKTEINTAFNWICSNIDTGYRLFTSHTEDSKSFRKLHPVESRLIGSESYGFLIQMKELGMINNMEMENIIDRIISSTTERVDLTEMKFIISTFIFDQNNFNRIATNSLTNPDEFVH